MRVKERAVVAAILLLIAVLAGFDVFKDAREGVVAWHLAVEGAVAALALVGVYSLLRGAFTLRRRLQKVTAEAEAWRTESRKHIEGLARAIDQQLDRWNLTAAEKEVAFLLLKGLSLKEIAEVRKTSEKTARVQSTAIYAKASLTGRSELAAFFLEDLLVPQGEAPRDVGL